MTTVNPTLPEVQRRVRRPNMGQERGACVEHGFKHPPAEHWGECTLVPTYRIVDLRLRSTVTGMTGLSWSNAHELADAIRDAQPNARFDIRREW